MTPGGRLGHYEIISTLGAGGMGEVWRARDTRLNRDVAIKVLPEPFAGDADRMARFQREAQVLASLNHPNIAAIYGVEERALVMELVEGETLEQRIAQGPIPLDEALGMARQMGDALEYAHERGIVHRDLKPANVKVTAEGTVKVLDFGLAKAMQGDAGLGDPASSPTLTMRATMAGTIIGTAAYMAPEQARAKSVDKRADIWAYGVVLYEMLSGRRLFEGETISDTLAAVLTRGPDLDLVPEKARRLVRQCLERDPKLRLRDMGDARLLLDDVAAPAPVPVATPRSRRGWIAATSALGLALVLMGTLWWQASRPVARALQRFDIEFEAPDRLYPFLAISPDGSRMVLLARAQDGTTRLQVRLLDQPNAVPLPGTENARDPFFSPDGQWVAFAQEGALKKMLISGGTPVKICDVPDMRGGSWGEDGNIVFTTDNRAPLYRVSAAGGTPQKLTELKNGEISHRFPQVLPGAKAVLFTAGLTPNDFEDSALQILSLPSGTIRAVHRGGYFGRYLAGHLLWAHQGALFAAAVDLDRAELKSVPLPVLDALGSNPVRAMGNFAVSPSGIFAALTGATVAGKRSLYWLDTTGKLRSLGAPPAEYRGLRLSPDGKRIALVSGTANKSDVFIYEWERDRMFPLTFTGRATVPLWTPDGTHILFAMMEASGGAIHWTRADGSSQAQRLLATQDSIKQQVGPPLTISPDCKRLVFAGDAAYLLPIDWSDSEHPKAGKPEKLMSAASRAFDAAISPDGQWLAYDMRESGGQPAVYVQPFPGLQGAAGGKWKVSTGASLRPVWARNVRALFFQSLDGHIMSAAYRVEGNSFVADKPQVWSPQVIELTLGYRAWDISADGKRAIVALPGDEKDRKPAHLTFLLNFPDELRRRVAAAGR